MSANALAQTSPASGPLAAPVAPTANDGIALADYLALLKQIAPAAEAGARDWLAAMQLRCGRTPPADALRRAISRDGGDPVLMDFIRAAAQQDTAARKALVARIDCGAPQ
ncbi:MAG: hypothetical protein LBF61_03560 [Azoarcus sp.]|nr:hypothetical protein [Azoarcus sp.]